MEMIFKEIDKNEDEIIKFFQFRDYFSIPKGIENKVKFEDLSPEDKKSFEIIDDIVFKC